MNWQNSYFSITSPFSIVERWLHPFHLFVSADMKGKTVTVNITRRARKALLSQISPLYVEMQLYLSCMRKKRVLFHEVDELQSSKINEHLSIAFRTVVATACDPVEFANHYPVKVELHAAAISKLAPSTLKIDFRQNQWVGEFEI